MEARDGRSSTSSNAQHRPQDELLRVSGDTPPALSCFGGKGEDVELLWGLWRAGCWELEATLQNCVQMPPNPHDTLHHLSPHSACCPMWERIRFKTKQAGPRDEAGSLVPAWAWLQAPPGPDSTKPAPLPGPAPALHPTCLLPRAGPPQVLAAPLHPEPFLRAVPGPRGPGNQALRLTPNLVACVLPGRAPRSGWDSSGVNR